MSSSDPTAGMLGLIQVFKAQTNGAADGTGIVVLLGKAQALLGKNVPSFLVDYVQGLQLGLFGSYPDHKDVAPSAVFVAIFVLIWFGHLYIFAKNYSRGHKFWLSLGFAFYALMRWLGFALRLVWAKDILKVKVGIASEVFLILPTIFLASFNLVLAQRLFTWRHPFLGSRSLFWAAMLVIYAIVVALVIMTIIAAAVPYLYLLSEHHYVMCQQVVKFTSVTVCLYSALSISLVVLAYIVPPTKRDHEIFSYQPWWIDSFSPFYFVEKDACKKAGESFIRRSHDHRHSVRTIPSSNSAFKQVQGLTNEDVSLSHNLSIFMVAVTSVFILVGAILRCITTFAGKTYAAETSIYKPVVMYILWPTLETIVNLIYLLGRVDLRFYRPCRLPKEARMVVTADQSSIESSSGEKDIVSNDINAELVQSSNPVESV